MGTRLRTIHGSVCFSTDSFCGAIWRGETTIGAPRPSPRPSARALFASGHLQHPERIDQGDVLARPDVGIGAPELDFLTAGRTTGVATCATSGASRLVRRLPKWSTVTTAPLSCPRPGQARPASPARVPRRPDPGIRGLIGLRPVRLPPAQRCRGHEKSHSAGGSRVRSGRRPRAVAGWGWDQPLEHAGQEAVVGRQEQLALGFDHGDVA